MPLVSRSSAISKKKVIVGLLAVGLMTVSLATAKTEPLSKDQWLKISEQRKLYFIFSKMEEFQGKGTVFNHSAQDYILFLDEASMTPQGSSDMDSVFESVVHRKEGSSR